MRDHQSLCSPTVAEHGHAVQNSGLIAQVSDPLSSVYVAHVLVTVKYLQQLEKIRRSRQIRLSSTGSFDRVKPYRVSFIFLNLSGYSKTFSYSLRYYWRRLLNFHWQGE